MKILSVLTALFFIASTSCQKILDKPGPNQISFAGEAMDYAQLPLNRYFIYKDSATGDFDSVGVTQSDLSNIDNPAYPGTGLLDPPTPAYNHQKFKLTLTKLNGSPAIWFQGVADAYNSNLYYASTSLSILTFYGNDNIISPNEVNGYGFSYPTPSFDTVLNFPNFKVGNNIYNNVLGFISASAQDGFTQPWDFNSTYYWAKGVGIVQRTVRTIYGTTTSFLERYGN